MTAVSPCNPKRGDTNMQDLNQISLAKSDHLQTSAGAYPKSFSSTICEHTPSGCATTVLIPQLNVSFTIFISVQEFLYHSGYVLEEHNIVDRHINNSILNIHLLLI